MFKEQTTRQRWPVRIFLAAPAVPRASSAAPAPALLIPWAGEQRQLESQHSSYPGAQQRLSSAAGGFPKGHPAASPALRRHISSDRYPARRTEQAGEDPPVPNSLPAGSTEHHQHKTRGALPCSCSAVTPRFTNKPPRTEPCGWRSIVRAGDVPALAPAPSWSSSPRPALGKRVEHRGEHVGQLRGHPRVLWGACSCETRAPLLAAARDSAGVRDAHASKASPHASL